MVAAWLGSLAGEASRKDAETMERGVAGGKNPENSIRRTNVVYCLV